MNFIKSVLAILAGLIFIFVTHNGTDFLLESLSIFTPWTVRFDTTWMVITATLYRAVFSVIGCYIAAALAPRRPMLHATILGAIGVVLSTIGAVLFIPLNLGPAWYPMALIVMSLPCAWLGGKLYTTRHRAEGQKRDAEIIGF